ncbi:MAG: IS1096 element passenger TnpR family protein [Terrimicrobiaceae bacterium]
MQIHTIKLQLGRKFEAVVAVSGTVSLYGLAETLIGALGFQFDHAFGFYDNLKNPYDSRIKYTLFADMGESDDGEPGVEKTPVSEVFTVGKKMLFYFDYGDQWLFPVTCTEVQDASSKRKIRRILSTKGTPPVQYPPCEED